MQKVDLQTVLAVFAAVLLSLLTYHLVEKNLRFNESKIVIIILVLLMIFIGIFTKKMSEDP